MKRFFFVSQLFLTAIILLVVGGCNTQKKETDQKTEKASLRLAWIPGVTFTGDYVAQNKGFWRSRGLEVTLNPGGFEFDAIKLVSNGTDMFGITSGPQIIQARANGLPVVAIGAIIPKSPIGWIAKKSSGITDPYKFVGKRIGAQFGTHTEITFEALMDKLNISLSKVKRIPVKFDPRPFIMGEVDVLPVYIIDQTIDLKNSGIDLNIINPFDYGVGLSFGNVYFTTEKTIKTKPEIVKMFLEGAKEAWQWVYYNRDASIIILAKVMQEANKSVLKQKLETMLDFIMKGQEKYMGVFKMTENDWYSTYSILREFGDIKESININSCFTNNFNE